MTTTDLEFIPARAAAAAGYMPPAPETPVMCSCPQAGATELDELDHLINVAGVDQVLASQALWARHMLTEPLYTHHRWATRTVTAQVQARFGDVLTWLGLP